MNSRSPPDADEMEEPENDDVPEVEAEPGGRLDEDDMSHMKVDRNPEANEADFGLLYNDDYGHGVETKFEPENEDSDNEIESPITSIIEHQSGPDVKVEASLEDESDQLEDEADPESETEGESDPHETEDESEPEHEIDHNVSSTTQPLSSRFNLSTGTRLFCSKRDKSIEDKTQLFNPIWYPSEIHKRHISRKEIFYYRDARVKAEKNGREVYDTFEEFAKQLKSDIEELERKKEIMRSLQVEYTRKDFKDAKAVNVSESEEDDEEETAKKLIVYARKAFKEPKAVNSSDSEDGEKGEEAFEESTVTGTNRSGTEDFDAVIQRYEEENLREGAEENSESSNIKEEVETPQPARKRGRPKKVVTDLPRKRGRPRKNPVNLPPSESANGQQVETAKAPKKRGRPRKDQSQLNRSKLGNGEPAPKKRGRPRKSDTAKSAPVSRASSAGLRRSGRFANEPRPSYLEDKEDDDSNSLPNEVSTNAEVEELVASVQPKKRGRPRKTKVNNEPRSSEDNSDDLSNGANEQPRKRGRPRKSKVTSSKPVSRVKEKDDSDNLSNQTSNGSNAELEASTVQPRKRGRPRKDQATNSRAASAGLRTNGPTPSNDDRTRTKSEVVPCRPASRPSSVGLRRSRRLISEPRASSSQVSGEDQESGDSEMINGQNYVDEDQPGPSHTTQPKKRGRKRKTEVAGDDYQTDYQKPEISKKSKLATSAPEPEEATQKQACS
ncbi:hypothetical protein L596_023440 [Steinernema carpocapsae]|uniref:Uncharacterized protein n=1 Tax=Steinernema carpocapsae TaxID=34508 RepID=A0A4U5MDP6_STECR|nr:hypothetical protein L596_023440 [Steinernema carpocapsae]